jgi:nucleotide-binding universal stress UspA family protein
MSQLRECLADAAPGYDRIGAAVRHGDPGTEILRVARGTAADLIVMGAPSGDRPERPIGPVASVAARSECSVLTVPAHQETPASDTGLFSRIVCAVDLSPSSRGVIHQALSLAWETQGTVTYLCAAPDDASMSSIQIRDRLLGAMPPEATTWCRMDVIVTTGMASTHIIRLADAQKADVIVIGAPRRWRSTTHAVLTQSRCPVLVTHDARPLPRPPG